MKILFCLLFSLSAFANDAVVSTLQKENKLLKEQIAKNEELIKLRQSSSYKLSSNSKPFQQSGELKWVMGAEAINWGEDVRGAVPTVGVDYSLTKKWSLGASFGAINLDHFPADDVYSRLYNGKAQISYNIPTKWEWFQISPIVGYTHIVVESPGAGDIDDPYLAEQEKNRVEDLENLSGVFAGVGLIGEISNKWSASLKVEFGRSTGLFANYKL